MMMKRWLLLAMAAAVVTCGAARAAESPEEQLKRAMRLEEDGALQKAVEVYEGFLKENPDHIRICDVRYRLALCHDNMGDPEKAIGELASLIQDSKDNANFKHRTDAFMHLAKLQGNLGKREDAVKSLETLIAEGAGLYEAEAYNLCGTHHALLGNYEKAAAMFNILRNKQDKKLASEGAFKLAVTWLKAEKVDLAMQSVDEFAKTYPGDARVAELYMKVAKYFYEKKDFAKVLAICEQVRAAYPDRPDALEAAFVIALCYKEGGKFAQAADALRAIAGEQKKNREIAVEAIFEAAQIYHKKLNDMDRAVEYYRLAGETTRRPQTERERQICEYSLLQVAEHYFQKEKWAAALDCYVILHNMGTKLNVMARILTCQAKLSPDGEASLSAMSEAELAFIKERVAQNPGTLLAAQGELFLLDVRFKKLLSPQTGTAAWKYLEPVEKGFAEILTKYSEGVLKEGDLPTYVYLQMGNCRAAAGADAQDPGAAKEIWKQGMALYEKSLSVNPQSLNRTAALESIARLATRLGDGARAFSAYKTLYEITGQTKEQAGAQKPAAGAAGAGEGLEDKSIRYLAGMVAQASTPDMLEEAAARAKAAIAKSPDSREARQARFYLAEIYFLMKRYSDAVTEYREFIRRYGPKQDAEGNVLPDLRAPKTIDADVIQVYDAGIRVARAWFQQGHTQNMLKAYRWVTQNQPEGNPYLAEAWYYTANNLGKGPDGKETAAGLEQRAEALWKQLVNSSLDFGSKSYATSFRPWIRGGAVDARARKYVEAAILKAGQIYSDRGKHDIAAGIFRQHLALWVDDGARRRSDERMPLGGVDIARYALGRALIETGEFDAMTEVYRPYVDGLRADRFRCSALRLLGYYGTKGERYEDAREAYAALLDEFGEPNALNRDGQPVPVPAAQRLRPKSAWNGIRTKPPEKMDIGDIRFSLGFMYQKQEDWTNCVKALRPFVDEASLATNKAAPQALLMIGRGYARLKNDAAAVDALSKLVAAHKSFQGTEDACVDLIRSACRGRKWDALDAAYARFVERFPQSDRRPYMDLYQAVADIERGRAEAGRSKLDGLARADTFEDVKADANYHLARALMQAAAPDYAAAAALLKKSVELYPRETSLYEAARCAVALKQWPKAGEYLDRAIREFPKGDAAVIREAKALMQTVMQEQAKTKRG